MSYYDDFIAVDDAQIYYTNAHQGLTHLLEKDRIIPWLVDHTDAEVLIFGGAIRSLALGQPIRDIDIALCGNIDEQDFDDLVESVQVAISVPLSEQMTSVNESRLAVRLVPIIGPSYDIWVEDRCASDVIASATEDINRVGASVLNNSQFALSISESALLAYSSRTIDIVQPESPWLRRLQLERVVNLATRLQFSLSPGTKRTLLNDLLIPRSLDKQTTQAARS